MSKQVISLVPRPRGRLITRPGYEASKQCKVDPFIDRVIELIGKEAACVVSL